MAAFTRSDELLAQETRELERIVGGGLCNVSGERWGVGEMQGRGRHVGTVLVPAQVQIQIRIQVVRVQSTDPSSIDGHNKRHECATHTVRLRAGY